MKRILLLSGLSLFLVFCKKEKSKEPDKINEANPPEKTIDGRLQAVDHSTIFSNDKNLLITGDDGSRIFIAKTNLMGDEIWYHKYGEQNEFSALAITQTSNDDIFVCGKKYIRNTQGYHSVLMKFDFKGSFKWDSSYVFSGFDWATHIVPSGDGGVVMIAGDFFHGGSPVMNLFKVNSSGQLLWKRTLTGGQTNFLPRNLINTSDGGYLLTASSITSNNLFYWKTDSTGKVNWQTAIGGQDGILGFETIETSTGDFMTCGKYQTSIKGFNYPQACIMKMDASGNLIWIKHYEDPWDSTLVGFSTTGRGLVENSDKTITLLVDNNQRYNDSTNMLPPKFSPTQIDIYRMRLFKIDAAGDKIKDKLIVTSKTEGLPLYESFNLLGSNDEYIITGNYSQLVFIKGGNTK